MKIGIIGGGSIGLLFASYLSGNHDVCIYVRSNEQVDKLEKEGLILEREKNQMKARVAAASFENWEGTEDLTVIAVKQYHLSVIFEKIQKATQQSQTSFLFLQNGMGHVKWLRSISAENIFLGIVEHGAIKVKSNQVKHTGVGGTKLAVFKGSGFSLLKDLINLPSNHFSWTIEDDYEQMLLNKLIVNSVINPLTGILNIENGQLLKNPYYYDLFKCLFDEISNALYLQDKEQAFLHLKTVCKKTAGNRSSMLRDLEEGRQTEIDAILGYVLNKAKQKQINAPLTESLYQMIKGREFSLMEGR